jgi:hypothetical protein
MSEQRRFGESDHEPLNEDDILAQAIGQWKDELPSRDLWSGVATRIHSTQSPASSAPTTSPTTSRRIAFTLPQLAMAATLLIAVASGLTWMVARQPATGTAPSNQAVIQAYAVDDLEKVLREERDRLDPRTVLIIERNLKAIDAAINEARMALNDDPANPYLNSHLADARRRKLDLLRTATTLASAGGD